MIGKPYPTYILGRSEKDPLGGIPPKPPFMPPAFARPQIVK